MALFTGHCRISFGTIARKKIEKLKKKTSGKVQQRKQGLFYTDKAVIVCSVPNVILIPVVRSFIVFTYFIKARSIDKKKFALFFSLLGLGGSYSLLD